MKVKFRLQPALYHVTVVISSIAKIESPKSNFFFELHRRAIKVDSEAQKDLSL